MEKRMCENAVYAGEAVLSAAIRDALSPEAVASLAKLIDLSAWEAFRRGECDTQYPADHGDAARIARELHFFATLCKGLLGTEADYERAIATLPDLT